MTKVKHNPWPKIYSLPKTFEDNRSPIVVEYFSKVKLHGTNAAVQISTDGTITAQSRNRILSPEHDNYDFAKWVALHEEEFARFKVAENPLTVFGEWCGPNVQKGVALAQLPQRIFAVFALQYGEELIVCPGGIATILWAPGPSIDGMRILPWHTGPYTIDFRHYETSKATVAKIQADVDAVEACCPFALAEAGIEGTGEGLVLFPFRVNGVRSTDPSMMFKAKGALHRTHTARTRPRTSATGYIFANTFVTLERCQKGRQMCIDCGYGTGPQATGHFLKWLNLDIKDESTAELQASGLKWKDVSRAVNQAAANWWRGNGHA